MPADYERFKRKFLLLYALGCFLLGCYNHSPRYAESFDANPRPAVVAFCEPSPAEIERANRAFSQARDAGFQANHGLAEVLGE